MSIFISVDSLADKYPGISPFAYCLNSPVRFVDPTGMEGEDCTDLLRGGEPNKYAIYFKYMGTNFQLISSKVKSFHSSEKHYQNMNLGLGIFNTDIGLGSKDGSLDEPAAIREIGGSYKIDSNTNFQAGLQ